jgi:hypothetical protein
MWVSRFSIPFDACGQDVAFDLNLSFEASDDFPGIGVNRNQLRYGFPCFVITIPSGPTRSSNERQRALNSAAGTVFMSATIIKEDFSSHKIWPLFSAAAAPIENCRNVKMNNHRRKLAANVPCIADTPTLPEFWKCRNYRASEIKRTWGSMEIPQKFS